MSGSNCIDYDILTKTYRAGRQVTLVSNHTGSSSSMESCGALNVFQRSVERYNLKYEYYPGDGDSSSFQSVEEAKPYGTDFTIKKLECIGHIQKRVGGRLRKLRAEWQGEVTGRR